MTPAASVIVTIVAVLLLVGAVIFFIKGLLAGQLVPGNAYGVERQKTRHVSLISYFRGAFLLGLALILFAILGIGNLPEGNQDTETPLMLQTVVEEAATPGNSQPSATITLALFTVTPTSPIPTLTATPTSSPVPTNTPDILIAVVNSPNGLWLRDRPGGTNRLELLSDQTELVVLDGNETVDEIEWQRVRTPSGIEGWVAVEYIRFR